MSENVRIQRTQSLYNKYRPRRFDQLVGQQVAAQALRKSISSGKGFAHAHLMCGPRGCGKTSAARIVAAALNCPFQTDGEPCGQCELCQSILTGTLPGSVHEMNSADNRGINEMRELLSNITLAPQTDFKVYILDEVHMLTNEASSLLLKYLEEPPLDNIVFILATTDPEKVLPTILSRVVRHDFQLISKEELTQLVTNVATNEDIQISDSQLGLVVSNGRGSARDTLSQLQEVYMGKELSDDSRAGDLISTVIRGVADRNLGDLLVAIAQAHKGQYLNARLVAEETLQFFRDVLLYQSNPDLVSVPDDLEEPLRYCASSLADHTIIAHMETVSTCLATMRTSGSGRVALEGCLARLVVDPAGDQYSGLIKMIRTLDHKVTLLGMRSSGGEESEAEGDIWKQLKDETPGDWPGESTGGPITARRSARRRATKVVEESARSSEEAAASDEEEQSVAVTKTRRRKSRPEEPKQPSESQPAEAEEESPKKRRKAKAQAEDEPEETPKPKREKKGKEKDKPKKKGKKGPKDKPSESSSESEEDTPMSEADIMEKSKLYEDALDSVSGRNKSILMEGDWKFSDGHFVITTSTRINPLSQDKIKAVLGDSTQFHVIEE